VKKWGNAEFPANTGVISAQFTSLFHVYKAKSKEYCYSHYEDLVYIWEIITGSNQANTVALMPGLSPVSACSGYEASYALCGNGELVLGTFSREAMCAEGVYEAGVRRISLLEAFEPLHLAFINAGNQLLLLGKTLVLLINTATLSLIWTNSIQYEPVFLSFPEPSSPFLLTYSPQGPICTYSISNTGLFLSSVQRYRQAIRYLHVSSVLINTLLKAIVHIVTDTRATRALLCTGEAIGGDVWGYAMKGRSVFTWDRDGKGNLYAVKERGIVKLRSFEMGLPVQNNTFIVLFATHYCQFEPQMYSSLPGIFSYHHFGSQGKIGKLPLMMDSITLCKQLFQHLILIGTARISSEIHPIMYLISNHSFEKNAPDLKSSFAWLCRAAEQRKTVVRLSEEERIKRIDAEAVQMRRQRSLSEAKKVVIKKKQRKKRKPDYDDFSLV
jgi:hypothetical protein